MKEEMEKTKEKLDTLVLVESLGSEKVLELSVELDKLILNYYKKYYIMT